MASSSSSATSSQSPKKYDVFISFRGEDTRFNFTSHLREALYSKKIETYIDYRLEKGDEVWPSLEKAIEDSTLFLVIFSENYASSTWCLKELAKILECCKNEGHVVIPVFYGADPSHIRKQSKSYQKAFKEHEDKGIDKQQLQNWREALNQAANISGWHCSVDRNEAELIKEIIKCVMQKLDDKCPSEDYLKDLIGIRRKMADVESLLYKGLNDDVRFIGIWGMGGVGKTTLAKALFKKFHSAYEGSCFLSSVREKSKNSEIGALKKYTILKLLGDKKSDIHVLDDIIHANDFKRLRRKKVFIVLDDVDDHHEQLENLAGRHCWFGPGSKILVTTRDKQVFAKEIDDIYKVEVLNPNEAFQLFSLNAFKKDYGGDQKMRELAQEVTQYAHGNPLALKVLGSFLCGKSQEAWKSQLEKFQKCPFPKINDIIKLSFEGLDYEQKNIFLDIACFFNGCDVKVIVDLLDACGYSTIIGLGSLEDKALLDISYGKISMHRLIREMGRQVVREESLNDPRKRSRLWDSNEICEILEESKETGGDAIEGIILDTSKLHEEICLSPGALSSMPNLKFLVIHKNFREKNKLKFPSGVEFLPKKLKLLCWPGYPSKSLPATLKVENLVQIKMQSSKLTKLWDTDQNLVNLREINLSGSKDLIELPNFSKAGRLEKIYINYCSKLRSLHPSILSLQSLRRLELFYCKALTSLTSNTRPKSLDYLGLAGCSRLNKIVSLSLNRCDRVTSLDNLVDLHTPTHLNATYCNKPALNLRSLFDNIRTLKELQLADCDNLFEVPENISLLSSLADLHLSGTNIETLPSSIKDISSLRRLFLDGCKRLRFLPELPPSVSTLCAQDCVSLETFHFQHVHNFAVEHCYYNLWFTNSMKLDGRSIKAVEKKLLRDVCKANCTEIVMEYPGERVPEWFMYRTSEDELTLDLCSIPEPWDGGFIFCAVISKSLSDCITYVRALSSIVGENHWEYESSHTFDEFMSDHIVIWYNRKCSEVRRKIEEKKRDAESNTYHPLLKILFTMECDIERDTGEFEGVGFVKEFGVCPTSALLTLL